MAIRKAKKMARVLAKRIDAYERSGMASDRAYRRPGSNKKS